MSENLISRNFEGKEIHQRIIDGYISLNQMAEANGKRIDNWMRLKETVLLLREFENQQIAPSDPREQSKPALITMTSGVKGKRGGGGTWAHPDIAIQFAQWCNPAFALQVSRWVREWMTTGRNPLADMDRVGLRDSLKDDSRLRMTDQVKEYLEQIRRYDDKKYSGMFFARVHDAINKAVTGETAKQMKIRLAQILNKKIKENELIRDYFPSKTLQWYISMCETSANLMLKKGMHPVNAVEEASELVLPASYTPQPINFVEHIKEVRIRTQGNQPKLFDIDNK